MPGSMKAAQDRLARLTREPDLVLEGTIRELSTMIREGDRIVQPAVALWVDATTGTVRKHALLSAPPSSPEAVTIGVDALIEALVSPSVTSGGTPALPGRI